jgi:hypothetical protein
MKAPGDAVAAAEEFAGTEANLPQPQRIAVVRASGLSVEQHEQRKRARPEEQEWPRP